MCFPVTTLNAKVLYSMRCFSFCSANTFSTLWALRIFTVLSLNLYFSKDNVLFWYFTCLALAASMSGFKWYVWLFSLVNFRVLTNVMYLHGVFSFQPNRKRPAEIPRLHYKGYSKIQVGLLNILGLFFTEWIYTPRDHQDNAAQEMIDTNCSRQYSL